MSTALTFFGGMFVGTSLAMMILSAVMIDSFKRRK